jgi:hypothetical protein
MGDLVAKHGTRAVAKGFKKLGFDELAEKLFRQVDNLWKALNGFLKKVRPGKSEYVGKFIGSFTDAEAHFRNIVKPETIRPHSKWKGGYLAT